MTRMRAAVFALILLPLAACASRDGAENRAADANAAAFVPPPVATPTALPGQGHSVSLDAYIGKYPNDAVDGVSFYDRTEVGNALIDAVGDEQVRRLIASGEATQVPIFEQGDRIAASGCEPHNCGGHNWTFLVRRDGTQSEACVHDDAQGNVSRWYAGGAPVTRPGGCPTD